MPISLQVQLLDKTASYDRNFEARAGDQALVLVVYKAGDAESERTASHLETELKTLSSIGGKPAKVATVKWGTAEELRDTIKSRRAAVAYLSAGFGPDVGTIAKVLEGSNILTVTALPSVVPSGVVLGFDLVSGKPKLLVHLTQARRQNVDFKAEILKIAKVYN